jgi:AraC-like DNA-binding protein
MALPGSGEHSFRIAHALHLIEVVNHWNVTGEQLLSGSGLTRESLADARARVPVGTMAALLERARRLTSEPALGVHIGLQTRATQYGTLGFAVVTASTVREAIEASLRYGAIVTTALSMRLRVEKRIATLIVDEHANFGAARDIVLLASVVGLWQISARLTGRDLVTSVAEFALPEPEYADKIKGLTRLPMVFNRPSTQLRFDARSLDLPYCMPDPLAHRLAGEQCQSELDVLALNVGLTTRVRGLIVRPEGGCRGLDEVATTLNRSGRTLKRQLGGLGVSFSVLRDEALREKALLLLRSPRLSLAEIAVSLGYSNVTNFERAFLRWTSMTPAASRRAAGMVEASLLEAPDATAAPAPSPPQARVEPGRRASPDDRRSPPARLAADPSRARTP